MTITINISKEAEARLRQQALGSRKDSENFVRDMVERDAVKPAWDELMKPLHEQTKVLGLSDDDIEALVDSELADHRRKNPLRCR